MKTDIEELFERLHLRHKVTGRGPEGLYDLVLSLLIWQQLSAGKANDTLPEKLATDFGYTTIVNQGISQKQAIKALKKWEQQGPAWLKDILVPVDMATWPESIWQGIWQEWTDFGKLPNESPDITTEIVAYIENDLGRRSAQEAYYTPAALAQLMVHCLKGAGGSTSLYDPYPRTGNLLQATAQEITSIKNIEIATPPNLIALKIAVLRMLMLEGSPAFHFHLGDVAGNVSPTQKEFDLIISNPPFGTAQSTTIAPDMEQEWAVLAKKSNRLEVAFIGHILSHLSAKGKAVVLVPTIYLSGTGIINPLIRKIIEDNLLEKVIRLPGDLFATTRIESVVLCFNKARKKGEKVLLLDATQAIMSRGKQTSLDLEKVLAYLEKPGMAADVGAMMVTAEEIIQQEYRLEPGNYYKSVAAQTENTPTVSAAEAWQKCEEVEQQLVSARNVLAGFLQKNVQQS